MTALLTAQVVAFQTHFLQNVPVANFRGSKPHLVFLAETNEAQVTHNGSHNGILCQPSGRLQIRRTNCHHKVAVNQVALFIHCQAAVCVTVKCQAGIHTMFHYILLQVLHMGRTAVLVDIDAVGRIVQHMYLCAQFTEDLLCRCRSRTVGTVQRQLQSGQRIWNRCFYMVNVIPMGVLRKGDGTHTAAYRLWIRHSAVQNDGFNLLLQFIRQLVAIAAEHLNPVELTRVMRSGDHHTGIRMVFSNEIRHRRRWHNAQLHNVCAGRTKTC